MMESVWPSLRDGGPLPRPSLCSFLATTVDPSPNFGGGVGAGEILPRVRFSPSLRGTSGEGVGGRGGLLPARSVRFRSASALAHPGLSVLMSAHHKPSGGR